MLEKSDVALFIFLLFATAPLLRQGTPLRSFESGFNFKVTICDSFINSNRLKQIYTNIPTVRLLAQHIL